MYETIKGMKTLKIYLVCLLLTLGFFGISENSNSQSKKELRKIQSTQNYFLIDSVLNSKRFVFKIDFMMSTLHSTAVNPAVNFIEIDGDKGVLQVGFNSANSVIEEFERNVIGGFTARGDILSWKLSQDSKKLNHLLKFNLLAMPFDYDINLTVTSDNHVTALIQGQVIWIGHLETIDNSGIFIGQTL
jgi:Domain of unknown function (DUF4251)